MDEIGVWYAAGRRRLSEVVLDLGPEEVARPVPACPDWTVHDVVAHLAGVCADVVAGRIEGITTAAWADAQVRRGSRRTLPELVAEWSSVAPILEADSDHLPPRSRLLWILDLTAHEHDLRGAVDRPGARDAPAVLAAVEFLVTEGLARQLVGRDLGPLEIRTAIRSWLIGARNDGSEGATLLETSVFELFRALTGRRSCAQIAAWSWSADPEPFLPAFEFGTFTTRPTELVE